MTRVMLAALAALSAAACATAPSSEPMETVSSGAPEPLAGHDWFLNYEHELAWLTYGAENSDDIWLTLICVPGKSVIELNQPAVAPGAIRLESGGDTETYPAEAAPSELHELLLTARARVDDPVFQRFRRLGWLATWSEGQRAVMVSQPGSTGRIESFFAACG